MRISKWLVGPYQLPVEVKGVIARLTSLAWQRDTISATIASIAVPLSPIATSMAIATVPSATVLLSRMGTEREEVKFVLALAACVFADQMFQGNRFVFAWKQNQFLHLLGRQLPNHGGVFNCAIGHLRYIHSVEWIFAVDAFALIPARNFIFEAFTSARVASPFALTTIGVHHRFIIAD